MKDEIKEILELFKEYASGGMSGLYPPEETIKILLDYITNLQEENKKLNGKVKMLEHNCKQAEDSCRQHRLASKNKKRRLERKDKQLERYKNIIDELEKHLKQRDNFLENRITLDKLKELKERNKIDE